MLTSSDENHFASERWKVIIRIEIYESAFVRHVNNGGYSNFQIFNQEF